MSKDFSGNLDKLLYGGETPPPGEKDQDKQPPRPDKKSKKVKPGGETRATFIVDIDLLNRVKEIAYIERLKQKDVLNSALREYIQKYDKSKK